MSEALLRVEFRKFVRELHLKAVEITAAIDDDKQITDHMHHIRGADDVITLYFRSD